MIALFVSLGGVGYAATQLEKNSVGPKQIRKNAVRSPKVKDRSLRAVDFAKGQLPAGPQGPQGPPGVVGSVVVRRTDFSLPAGPAANEPGESKSGFVACGPDEKIIGGSVNVSDPANAQVQISRPSGDPSTNNGNGDIPEDGQGFSFWKGTARTTTNVAATARVFAICAKNP
ncbi:MAG TPA: hypothetical protein VG898_09420 [Solirubrobacterales bacterium]|nr:hypothetical protein [Solirubrobacterales bacterium]